MSSWMDRLTQWRALFDTTHDIYRHVAGIDVDESALVCVQLHRAFGKTKVLTADVSSLPAGAILEDTIIDAPAFSSAVKTMLARQSSAQNASIALPGSKVVIKQIPLEKQLPDDTAETLAWQEAKHAFPELAKSLMLDFAQVENVTKSGEKKHFLLLVVARKEDITPRVEALQNAGLTTKIVDVDYYALERAYPLFASQLPVEHEKQYVGIIDFNPRSLLLVVMYQKRMVYFTRHSYAGGSALIPLVKAALQHEATPRVTEEQHTQIVMAIRHLFQLFYTENTGKMITTLAITGRCALLTETIHALGAALNIPVVIPDPFSTFHFSQPLAPAFVLGCGLALRGA